jgi:3-dehydroquinate synthase/shikimate kinase/3-dehydroquinate synthase
MWLIGMMGSGKTTMGAAVAARLGWRHVDVDAEIEARMGCSIGELWGSAGEEAFRDMESAQIAKLADESDVIVSTGGGVVLRGENIRIMRDSGVVVWLDAPIEVLAGRVANNADRPLLSGGDQRSRLSEIFEERRERYRGAAHHRVDSAVPTATLVDRLVGHARVTVGDSSEVLIGADLPLDLLPDRPERQQAVILTQPGARPVADEVAASLAGSCDVGVLELPDREAAKTVEVVAGVYERLAELNVGRHDTVIGVGGGTVTDTAGFVAATWLRGVEFVAIPTTLLAAVDAAIGGKTGLNVSGKNLVGAFWHPTRVNVSLAALAAAPREITIEGSAEAVKAGFIADRRILEVYERHGAAAPLGQVVPAAIAVKAAVVADDFREQGNRAILNFGHTLGHGIETVTGIPHGHAVAIGMVAAGAVSHDRYGFDSGRLVAILRSLELPTDAPGVDRAAVLELVARDKKRTAAGIRMVLLEDFGRPVVELVSPGELDAGLAAIGIV